MWNYNFHKLMFSMTWIIILLVETRYESLLFLPFNYLRGVLFPTFEQIKMRWKQLRFKIFCVKDYKVGHLLYLIQTKVKLEEIKLGNFLKLFQYYKKLSTFLV